MRVSVITVCLNAEKYLQGQLESVASQEWGDVEHVAVDGGSCDGTVAILKAAAERNPVLRWSSAPDRGISDAMNKGLALATGDIVTFLHADDFYPEPSVLSSVTAAFQAHPQIEWLTGGIRYVDEDGRTLRCYPPRRWSYRRLLRGNIIFHPSTFVRREALAAAGGFDIGLRYTMDYDLWLRLGKRSAPYLLRSALASFRVHPGSTSVRNVDAAFREELQVRLRYLRGGALHRLLHLVYFGLKFLPNRLSQTGWPR